MIRADASRGFVALSLAIALVSGSVAFFTTAPASAATETIVPSVEAAPGTVSGNPGDLAVADDVRVTVAQEDVTAVSDTLALVPDGDIVPNDWDVGGCIPGHYCALLVIDDNTTFLSTTTLAERENVSISDFPFTDIAIGTIRTYVWARENSTNAANNIGVTAFASAACVQSFSISPIQLTPAYQNFTDAWFGPAECLTISAVEGAVLWFDSSSTVGMTGQAVTAVGFTVEYTDSDFQVVAYLNFSSIPCPGGCDYELRWEGYEDGPDSALLQVDADNIWSTIATLDSSGDAGGSYVVPAEYADTGAIRFRIIDTVLDDETGGNVYLDLFAVDVTPQGGGGTGLPPVEVACAYQWASGDLHCTAIVRIAESLIDGRVWLLDDRVVAQGRPGSHSIDVQVGRAFAPFHGTWNITLEIITVAGSVLRGTTTAVADSMWLWAVYGFFILVIIILIANRYRPPRARTDPPKEMHRERERRGREGSLEWR